LKSKHWTGIRRQPEGEEDRSKPGKRTVVEAPEKCGKTWREVKSLARNRVSWRRLKNDLCFKWKGRIYCQALLCCGDME
jgi:hypothetical protein